MRIILIKIIFLNNNYMKKLYEKSIKAYLEMLTLHIDTKTTDVVFHKETEKFYDTLFDVAHSIWEKYVDLWWTLDSDSLIEKEKRANLIISNLRKEIENYKSENKVSLWTEDLLWSLANSLENIEWTSKWFLK